MDKSQMLRCRFAGAILTFLIILARPYLGVECGPLDRPTSFQPVSVAHNLSECSAALTLNNDGFSALIEDVEMAFPCYEMPGHSCVCTTEAVRSGHATLSIVMIDTLRNKAFPIKPNTWVNVPHASMISMMYRGERTFFGEDPSCHIYFQSDRPFPRPHISNDACQKLKHYIFKCYEEIHGSSHLVYRYVNFCSAASGQSAAPTMEMITSTNGTTMTIRSAPTPSVEATPTITDSTPQEVNSSTHPNGTNPLTISPLNGTNSDLEIQPTARSESDIITIRDTKTAPKFSSEQKSPGVGIDFNAAQKKSGNSNTMSDTIAIAIVVPIVIVAILALVAMVAISNHRERIHCSSLGSTRQHNSGRLQPEHQHPPAQVSLRDGNSSSSDRVCDNEYDSLTSFRTSSDSSINAHEPINTFPIAETGQENHLSLLEGVNDTTLRQVDRVDSDENGQIAKDNIVWPSSQG